MIVIGSIKCATAGPNLNGTHWICETCGSFVSVHSLRVVPELDCPLCGAEMLESFIAFDSELGKSFGDA